MRCLGDRLNILSHRKSHGRIRIVRCRKLEYALCSWDCDGCFDSICKNVIAIYKFDAWGQCASTRLGGAQWSPTCSFGWLVWMRVRGVCVSTTSGSGAFCPRGPGWLIVWRAPRCQRCQLQLSSLLVAVAATGSPSRSPRLAQQLDTITVKQNQSQRMAQRTDK